MFCYSLISGRSIEKINFAGSNPGKDFTGSSDSSTHCPEGSVNRIARMALRESSVSERGGRRLLLLLALVQFGLNLGHPRGCLLMTVLRREPVKREGLREIFQTTQTARFKRLTHA